MKNTIIIKNKVTNKEYIFNTEKSLNINFSKIRKRVFAFINLTIKNLNDINKNNYIINITGYTKTKKYTFSI